MNRIIFLLVCLAVTYTVACQTTRYWVSTTSGTWSDSLNWSTTLNGTPGGGVPRSGENAIFDGSNKGACIVDININLNKLETRNGYNKTITFESINVAIGSAGIIHNSGTMNCANAVVSVTGDLAITDPFVSTSQTLVVGGDFLLDLTANFDPVEGTVLFNSVTNNEITNSPQFYDLILKGVSSGTSMVVANEGFSVYQDLIIDEESSDIKVDGGLIAIGGDFYPRTAWKNGTAGINLNGLGNQQLYIEGSINLSELALAKVSGNAFCHGSLSIENDLILNHGNLLIGNADSILLDTLCVITGANGNSFVDGKIVKIGSTEFTFPCGSGSTFAPVAISNLSSIQQVSCRYYSSATPNSSEINPPVNFIDVCSYWNIKGTVNKTLKLTFSPFEYSACLSIDIIDSSKLLNNTNGTWNNQTATIVGSEIQSMSISPNGLYSLGSTGINTCADGPLYWVGATSNDWSDAQNWSEFSGGPGGYGIPCKSSTVIFDGNGNINCELEGNVEVAKALFRPDYTAEITTNGFSLRIKELFK